jgi:urea transporter
MAVVGSAAATLTATAVGVGAEQINLGLIGLNGFLTCVALGSVFAQRRTALSALWGAFGAAAATVAAVALNRIFAVFGLPGSITLAYCLITPLLVGSTFLSARLHTPGPAPEGAARGAESFDAPEPRPAPRSPVTRNAWL